MSYCIPPYKERSLINDLLTYISMMTKLKANVSRGNRLFMGWFTTAVHTPEDSTEKVNLL
ncbi:MAG: hypothetical protein F6K10_04465 [Moorea sp. SIO2B7]|nr:hypothetical protein [Moorena sp. SIO2B7]